MSRQEMQTRAAKVSGSLDVQARTVDVIFASEQPVRRRDWNGPYDEILLCTPENVDLSRADNMPLLDSHGLYTLDDRLGAVVPGSIRFERGQVIAKVKLSRRAKAQELLEDLQDGMSLPISVGYRIAEEERTEALSGGVATVKATRWQPMEISVVPVPADPNAKTRSEEQMPQEIEESAVQERRAVPNNVINERRRIAELRSLARIAKAEGEELERAIEDGTSVEEFRKRMFDLMVARQEQTPTFPMVETRSGDETADLQRKARQDALVARMTGKAPEGAARDFMSDSLLDHARGLLEARGVRTTGMRPESIFGFRGSGYSYHSVSDFPLLLQGAGERVLMDGYMAAQSPLKTLLARSSMAKDFRAKSKLKISDGGLLEKVNEHGEITAMTRSEASESYKIDSYGRTFSLSFQALVNDDLNAFADWATFAGQMAALTENKVLLDLLLSGSGAGPTMNEDSKTLFHADHGNLANAGTALDEANLGAAILAFRKLKAFGGHRIAISPKYLLIGPELEMTAQKLLASITPAKTDDAVPEAIKSLIPVVEPNLDGKAWYLFADPSVAPVFEYAHLSGHEGVQLDSEEGFSILGTTFRAVLHFGAGAIDWRGAYRNPGL